MARTIAEKPRHFRTAVAFRRWLEKHHDRTDELWVAFWRKESGKGGITYPEARDEALCFGWIDGVRKRLDDERYVIRFTPRKLASKWSEVNLRRYEALRQEGRIAPPGRVAFERFDPSKHTAYSFEGRVTRLSEELQRTFRARHDAWHFFQAQPPGYRRTTIYWVMSAKRAETRERRLARLIDVSAAGRRLPQISGG